MLWKPAESEALLTVRIAVARVTRVLSEKSETRSVRLTSPPVIFAKALFETKMQAIETARPKPQRKN